MNNRYRRGANFERELISKFWDHGWSALRAAGSGTTTYPVPDVVALYGNDVLVIECKTTGKDRLSLKSAVQHILRFSKDTNARGVIAIKFTRRGTRFYPMEWIKTKGNYTISDKDPYLSFDALIGDQSQLPPQ